MFAYSLHNSTSFIPLPLLYQTQADCRSFRAVTVLCLCTVRGGELQQGMFLAALHRIPPCLPQRGAPNLCKECSLTTGSLWDEEQRRELPPAQHLRRASLTRCLPMHRHTHTLLQDANLPQAEEAVSSSDMAHPFWSI